mgnify:CR=1 FL=1
MLPDMETATSVEIELTQLLDLCSEQAERNATLQERLSTLRTAEQRMLWENWMLRHTIIQLRAQYPQVCPKHLSRPSRPDRRAQEQRRCTWAQSEGCNG